MTICHWIIKLTPKSCSAQGSAHSHAAICSTANFAGLLTAVHVLCRKKLQLSLVTLGSSADKCSKLHQLSRSIRNITTLVSRLSTEVVKRSRFSSLFWKRQAGNSLKADYKSVTLGFTPALSVSATSKWKNEWSRITPVPCQQPCTERSHLLCLACGLRTVVWEDVIVISCRRHVHHARMLLSVFDLIKDTLSPFPSNSVYLATAK